MFIFRDPICSKLGTLPNPHNARYGIALHVVPKQQGTCATEISNLQRRSVNASTIYLYGI